MPDLLQQIAEPTHPLRLHVLGVAGSGMSGLAALLIQRGHQVSGSDRVSTADTDYLRGLGLRLSTPHNAADAEGCDAVIYSSAVKPGNVTYDAALALDIPLIRRAEALAALMRGTTGIVVAGTHGKTTTSAMAAHALRHAGLRPGHYVGAETPVLGRNAHWEAPGSLFVAEGDESDGTITCFHPHHTILLNVEADHLDFHADLDAIHTVFRTLLANTSGTVFFCADDPGAAALGREHHDAIAYGFSPQADIRATDATDGRFRASFRQNDLGWFQLALPGRHNILNALAVIALGTRLGIAPDSLRDALASFRGARRRFETRYRSQRFHLVDDYGHHPTEIRATLEAACSAGSERVLCLFQPHRYSRTRALREQFARAFDRAEAAWITRVYPAGEPQQPDAEGDSLVEAARAADAPTRMRHIPDLASARLAAGNAMRPGDLLITLGAGNVHECATPLARDLATLDALIDATGEPNLVARLYEPMRKHTTMLVGGCAQFWAEPSTFESLAALVRHARATGLPLRVLGRGSNLIIRDGGIPGLVIHPARGEFAAIEAGPDGTIRAGAGVRLKALAAAARTARIGGLEWMEGVPGLVGGALRMNAGAMGIQTFDQTTSIRVLTHEGGIEERPAHAFHARYRDVPALDHEFALEAVFQGTPDTPLEAIDAAFEASRSKRRSSQPVAASAGCAFKNPSDSHAGSLIDQLGLKGLARGGARVSQVHGNFIVNENHATARDVLALIEEVRLTVKNRLGIQLEPEVKVIGEEDLLF